MSFEAPATCTTLLCQEYIPESGTLCATWTIHHTENFSSILQWLLQWVAKCPILWGLKSREPRIYIMIYMLKHVNIYISYNHDLKIWCIYMFGVNNWLYILEVVPKIPGENIIFVFVRCYIYIHFFISCFWILYRYTMHLDLHFIDFGVKFQENSSFIFELETIGYWRKFGHR